LAFWCCYCFHDSRNSRSRVTCSRIPLSFLSTRGISFADSFLLQSYFSCSMPLLSRPFLVVKRVSQFISQIRYKSYKLYIARFISKTGTKKPHKWGGTAFTQFATITHLLLWNRCLTSLCSKNAHETHHHVANPRISNVVPNPWPPPVRISQTGLRIARWKASRVNDLATHKAQEHYP
jgi:hypothetical protein